MHTLNYFYYAHNVVMAIYSTLTVVLLPDTLYHKATPNLLVPVITEQ